ncbi:DUF6538 domain-containing protein [Gluconobacter japonicus]|uniref:DUF6538 domain-containing protein n=1 Tax=Gluconobacter japonicus TaxID=376620 RepID=UPI0039E8CBF2
MLRVRGTTYHFRHIVPPALRAALNRREIWVSLKTGYQSEARKRASLLHARTTELFDETHRVLAERQERQRISHVRDILKDLHRLVENSTGIGAVPLPVSIPRPRPQKLRKAAITAPKVQSLLLSEALTRFVLENPHAGTDTRKATQRAVELFLQAYGDAPVTIIGLHTSKDGIRGTAFERYFSTMKIRLGLPSEITFHSFRHSVSTQLRNTSADIREI